MPASTNAMTVLMTTVERRIPKRDRKGTTGGQGVTHSMAAPRLWKGRTYVTLFLRRGSLLDASRRVLMR
jgi:hypothetical protein